jgi:hypothetical protein
MNYGQKAFAHTPPTGFSALNASNLPAPDIADGSQYFNIKTYTGTGGSQSLTGVGFQPDLTWVKGRSNVEFHNWTDAVRGAPAFLLSDAASAEQSYTGKGLTSFDSDGFTVYDETSGGYAVNATGRTYVAWNWLAANGTEVLTTGSINSTVSANPSAGFSIATYTGNGTSGATIAHGLGVAPAFAIFKARNAVKHWLVYHQSLGATKGIYLSLTLAAETDTAFFNNTAPTSTVMTLGNNSAINAGSQTQVAYFFAEIEGYSKFGSYTGNGSTDGPFVYCGFKPRWIMIKVTDQATTSWMVRDTARNPYNIATGYLLPNSNSQEFTNLDFDIYSNGFKPRHTNGVENVSGKNYIFAAFSENPFGGDGVSPATAR